MSGIALRTAAVLIPALCASSVAHAHALDIAYLRVEPPTSAAAPANVVLDLDVGAVALLFEIEPAAVTSDVVRAKAGELVALTIAKQLPTTAAGPCTLGAAKAELVSPSVRVTTTLACPAGARTWSFPFLADARVPATFQLLVKDVATDRLTVVERATPAVELTEAKPAVATTSSSSGGRGEPAGTLEAPRRTYVAGGMFGLVALASIGFVASRRKRS